MTTRSLYLDGRYLIKNPAWHVEQSAGKAKDRISPSNACEVGCGAGEVLKQMQPKPAAEAILWGYDVSLQAIELAKNRTNERLRFRLADSNDFKDAHL
jgi:2-polyprenyl-3-methyl-5-hydroxy-6-metoxy-1,4-benzoquinol methylase